MNKYKSSFFNNCYEWLLTEDERAPMGFIPTFLLVIVVSTAIGVVLIPMINHIMK
jgi:cell division protein FtsL|tara:strand:+ start:411 stop:575 length:165 start_codon:yes stop_codon:yes gene_type:complete